MTALVQVLARAPNTPESAGAVLDGAKARLLSGESVGFVMVEIGPDDATYISSAFTRVMSQLKAQGAAFELLMGINAGAINKED